MNQIKPQIFLIGETRINNSELDAYLHEIDADRWSINSPSDSEKLIEVYGRLCYRSFLPGLNPNVKKVREGNDTYIKNILKSQHGSVLEHCTLNFILHNISRVVTHELVRHRTGTAISQESLRYVRLDKLSAYVPKCIKENDEAFTIFVKTFEEMEQLQESLSKMYDIDNEETFGVKKELTSAFRRMAPMGLATTMGWSVNLRALRHIIDLRTSPHSEEEIRLLFNIVYDKVKNRYPNVFSDFKEEIVNGLRWIYPDNKKI